MDANLFCSVAFSKLDTSKFFSALSMAGQVKRKVAVESLCFQSFSKYSVLALLALPAPCKKNGGHPCNLGRKSMK